MPDEFVIGVDVGTGGVRAVAVDPRGEVLAAVEEPLPPSASPQPGWMEQRPEDWWTGLTAAFRALGGVLGGRGRRLDKVQAVCVDSTSGTVLPVDPSGRPMRNALMYNDARASTEADELNRIGEDVARRMGYRFNSSYALAKVLWLVRREPKACERARFLSAADFLTGRLCGRWDVTDYTNALKMGYDLLRGEWPAWLEGLSIGRARLPCVHPSGEVIGVISKPAARETGLRAGAAVAAGPTDGVAAFYASGASRPGESATAIGTTLVVKSLSRSILLDPLGRIYCHKHATGCWLPGGASNCGCEYATKFFPGSDPAAMDRASAQFLPCAALCYPLARAGERFPIVNPAAERFLTPVPSCEAEHFAAYLQGVAFVERWAYEIISEFGGSADGSVSTSGGGSRSTIWMQLRADVLGRETACTAAPDSAFGSAVLAASRTWFGSADEAARALVRRAAAFAPRREAHELQEDLYHRFRDECSRRGMA